MTVSIDYDYVPRPRPDVQPVDVGDQTVLVDGWDLAVVVNRTGALIWDRIDGSAPVGVIAHELAVEAGADIEQVTRDVADFVGRLGSDGLLDEVITGPHDQPDGDEVVKATPMAIIRQGSVVEDLDGVDAQGRPVSLVDPGGRHRILVKWNPNCGYCAAVAGTLGEVQPSLTAAGVDLHLVCVGDVEANRRAAESAARTSGVELPILFASASDDPFPAVGTPSAYHVDGTGLVVSPTAHGSDEVPSLAATIAGVRIDERTDHTGAVIRYLRQRGGMCAPDMAPVPGEWESTRVYRVGDHHVGIRIDSEATGEVLDRVFRGARVDDDRAGHSYLVAVPGAAPAKGFDGSGAAVSASTASRASNPLNIFAPIGGVVPLRSRSPERVVRALLGGLEEDVLHPALPPGQVRVMARAVVIDGDAVVLPLAVDGFAPRLQPELARMGAALVDVAKPIVDLSTGSLVVPPLAVEHDRTVVDDLDRLAGLVTGSTAAGEGLGEPPAVRGGLEMPFVPAGTYPLRAWCTLRVGHAGVTPLTPAEAAAATVSSVCDTIDSSDRVRELGAMFERAVPRGLGIWYNDDRSFFDALGAALSWPATSEART